MGCPVPEKKYSTCQGEGGGGRGGGGGGGGGGERGRGRGGMQDFGPNPFKKAKLHRQTLGLIYGFTQRDPPRMLTLGVSGELNRGNLTSCS